MDSLSPHTDYYRWVVLFKSAILGAGRALISLPFQYPFDTIKTTMQSQQSSTYKTILHIRKAKGWKGFYNGFTVNSLRIASKQIYRWPLWLSLSAFYNDLLKVNNQLWKQTIIGFSISIVELIFLCPFERLKIWLMTTKTQQQTTIKNYFKANSSLRDLYTGFTPLLLRQSFSWISFLACSESFKNIYKEYYGIQTLDPLQLMLISVPVSFINTVLIMPTDCIKTFYQECSSKKKSWSLGRITIQALKEYGVRGLYRGWNVRLIQYTINSMFTLVLYEQLMKEYQNLK